MKLKVDSAGINVWSIHLPFSRTLDISVLNDSLRKENVKFMAEMIEQAAVFNPQRLVLHPSSEPISDEERNERLKNAKESIKYLKECADSLKLQLCIENLPRTCLGNTPEELLYIIKDIPGLKVCFDTNHYFGGTTQHFIDVLGGYIVQYTLLILILRMNAIGYRHKEILIGKNWYCHYEKSVITVCSCMRRQKID